MNPAEQKPKPKVRPKSFTYETDVSWLENRAGTLRSKDKPELRVASPPEFKGEAGTWTPEDLFVAAIDICTMTTFMAFAERKGIAVVSYASDAEGLLEFDDGVYRFTKVVLRPTIVVETQDDVEQAKKTIEDAHKKCLVANSVTTSVTVEATVKPANGA